SQARADPLSVLSSKPGDCFCVARFPRMAGRREAIARLDRECAGASPIGECLREIEAGACELAGIAVRVLAELERAFQCGACGDKIATAELRFADADQIECELRIVGAALAVERECALAVADRERIVASPGRELAEVRERNREVGVL